MIRAKRCSLHPSVKPICPACQGAKGGSVSSPAKTEAARRNAQRPRPRK